MLCPQVINHRGIEAAFVDTEMVIETLSQGPVLLLRHDAVARILAIFHWKLRRHWLKFLRQRQIAVVRQGPGKTRNRPWASYQIYEIAGCACADNAWNFFPPPRWKETTSWRSQHASRHVRHVPGIPGACATHNFTYLVRSPCRIFSDIEICMLSHIHPEIHSIFVIKGGPWWPICLTF